MGGFRYMTVFLLLLLSTGVSLRAQDDWDAVLDRYEQIAVQCRELRERVAAGESVPEKSVTSLVGELGRLRGVLGQASGSMTAAQRRRYERIRDSYLVLPERRSSPFAPAPAAVPASVRKPRPAPVVTEPAPVVDRTEERIVVPVLPETVPRFVAPGVVEAVRSLPVFVHATAVSPPAQTAPLSFNLLGITSFGDVWQYGIHLSCLHRRWGGYLSARSDFRSSAHSYDCLSDGYLPSGDRFLSGGGSRLGEWSVTAGGVWQFSRRVYVFAGAGYGSSTLCWRDASGSWARVWDYSAEGLTLEGGAVFSFGRIRLLGGVSRLMVRPSGGPFLPVFSIGAGIGL